MATWLEQQQEQQRIEELRRAVTLSEIRLQAAIDAGRQDLVPTRQQTLDDARADLAAAEAALNQTKSTAPTEPIPPTTQNTPNPNNITGSADSDNSNPPVPGQNPNTSPNNAGSSNNVTTQPNSASNTSTNKIGGGLPGRRPYNPLADFSSYTYQISLYMVSPEAYLQFVNSGRKDISSIVGSGAANSYLLAQSGGINDSFEKRFNGKEYPYDYYIDDLKIVSATAAKQTLSSTNVTSISFNITEPYGFSFVTNMRKAKDAIQSSIKNWPAVKNASRCFFMLGVRFLGYDKNGKVVTSSDLASQENLSGSDPKEGVYQRYYDITFTSIKFKIDGKATTYNITAAPIPTDTSFGNKRARVDPGMNIVAEYVEDALTGDKGLLTQLNKFQKDQVDNKSREIANEYSVEYLGLSEPIKRAKIVSKFDQDKSKTPMSKAVTVTEVNESTASKASPDLTRRVITFTTSISIIQAIDGIIAKSTYLEAALKEIANSVTTPNPETDAPDLEPNSGRPSNIKWYNLSAEVECLGWDTLVNDFAWKIKYIIQPYETPNASSPFATENPNSYYGPHKIYNYYFTGENSEVISFEQRFDNLYYQEVLKPNSDPRTHGHGAQVAHVPGQRPLEDRTNALGQNLDVQNTYRTSLMDQTAYAKSKISILGDPDFLIQASPSSLNAVYNQFYGSDGYSINPNGGQVFIEVGFKEPIDYKNTDGLLEINESILFYKYPPNIEARLKGRVSYQVINAESLFSKGRFVQNLDLVLNTFPNIKGSSGNTSSSTGLDASGRANAATDPRSLLNPNRDVRTGTNTDAPNNYITDYAATDIVPPGSSTMSPPSSGTERTSPTGGSNTGTTTISQLGNNNVVTPEGTTGTGTVNTEGVSGGTAFAGGQTTSNNQPSNSSSIQRDVMDDDGSYTQLENQRFLTAGRE